jgi:hypothetical protein
MVQADSMAIPTAYASEKNIEAARFAAHVSASGTELSSKQEYLGREAVGVVGAASVSDTLLLVLPYARLHG